MSNPKISILIPVYNVDRYLKKCLDSISTQTFKDFEVILVDDGSTDDCGRICDEYTRKDSRFSVIHKNNEGVAKARITAFEHCTGDLITFIDSDDYVHPEYLERLSQPILGNGMDMVSCNFYDVRYQGKSITGNKLTLEGVFSDTDLKDFISNHYFYDDYCRGYGMPPFLCGKMIKRDYVQKGLINGTGMWFGEDQTAMFSMLYKIKKLCIIPNRLYYYVHYKEQATQKYSLSLWESLIIMFERYKEIDTLSIAEEGLRKRTFLYIQNTILKKMKSAKLDYHIFIKHLATVRNNPYMEKFFQPSNIPFGFRKNILYWMLKLRLYSIIYILAIK